MAANEQYITELNTVFYVNSATTYEQMQTASGMGRTLVYDGVVVSNGYWLHAAGYYDYNMGRFVFEGWNAAVDKFLQTYRGSSGSWNGVVLNNGFVLAHTDYQQHLPTSSDTSYVSSLNVANYLMQQAGMPKAIVSGDSKLVFCNGTLLACADKSTTTAWTMDLATFYENYMKSLGAYTGTTNPSTSAMLDELRYRLSSIRFVRLPTTSSSSTTVTRSGYTHKLYGTSISVATASVGISATTSTVNIKISL